MASACLFPFPRVEGAQAGALPSRPPLGSASAACSQLPALIRSRPGSFCSILPEPWADPASICVLPAPPPAPPLPLSPGLFLARCTKPCPSPSGAVHLPGSPLRLFLLRTPGNEGKAGKIPRGKGPCACARPCARVVRLACAFAPGWLSTTGSGAAHALPMCLFTCSVCLSGCICVTALGAGSAVGAPSQPQPHPSSPAPPSSISLPSAGGDDHPELRREPSPACPVTPTPV